jgi:LysM repeat protein
MENGGQSSARYLAPLALALFAVVLVLVVGVSLSGSSGDGKSGDRGGQAREGAKGKRKGGRGKLPKNVYTVKPGDNFQSIAQKTGIPPEKLQQLNPDLDPQALISGQKVKLRG